MNYTTGWVSGRSNPRNHVSLDPEDLSPSISIKENVRLDSGKVQGSEQPQRQPVILYEMGGGEIRMMGLITSELPFQASGPQAEFIWGEMDGLGLIKWSGAWLLWAHGQATSASPRSLLEVSQALPQTTELKSVFLKFEKYSSIGIYKILEAGGIEQGQRSCLVFLQRQ